jgi:hypothetical protein
MIIIANNTRYRVVFETVPQPVQIFERKGNRTEQVLHQVPATSALITLDEPGHPHALPLGTGTAYCSPKEPVFNPFKGQRKALKRALEQSGLSREERQAFWKGYNHLVPPAAEFLIP